MQNSPQANSSIQIFCPTTTKQLRNLSGQIIYNISPTLQTKKRMLCGLGVKGLSFTLRLFHLWNTPRATFANRLFEGIPFIVGVAGGLPNGCGISGCVVIFLDKQLRNLYEIHVHMNCWICFVRVIHAGFAVLRVNSLPMWMILFYFMRIQCYC